MDEQIVKDLIFLLASNTFLWYKVSTFHWNVVGSDFPQLHKLFESMYEDVYDQIDFVAERIRMNRGFVPWNPFDLLQSSAIKSDMPEESYAMVQILEQDHSAMQRVLMKVFQTAQKLNDQGLMNYLAERMDAHKKWEWQLRATAVNK